ncbi:MAG: putative quinol monooxygenase [Gammaproteobacteria bacterium]
MLTFVARMKVKAGKEQEFIRLAKELTGEVLEHEPDTKLYCFYRLREEDRGFAVIESFTDDAAEEAHRNTAHFNQLAPALIDCLDGDYVREYLDPLE